MALIFLQLQIEYLTENGINIIFQNIHSAENDSFPRKIPKSRTCQLKYQCLHRFVFFLMYQRSEIIRRFGSLITFAHPSNQIDENL